MRSVANAAAAEAPLHLRCVFPRCLSLFVAAVVKPDRGEREEAREQRKARSSLIRREHSGTALSIYWKHVSIVKKTLYIHIQIDRFKEVEEACNVKTKVAK